MEGSSILLCELDSRGVGYERKFSLIRMNEKEKFRLFIFFVLRYERKSFDGSIEREYRILKNVFF